MAITLQAVPLASLSRTQVAPGAAGARQSLRIMRGIVLRYRYNPLVITYARQIVNIAGIRTRDYPAQVNAIFNWIQDNIAFTRDPRGIDLYMTPDVVLRTGAGDCDDMAILFATFLESLGHPAAFMAIQQPGFDTFNHVIALTRIGTRWICADCSDGDHALGYCPPAANTLVVYI